MISSNVAAEVTVQFNDQFTKSADQALEKYIESWKEVERSQKETANRLNDFFKNIKTGFSDEAERLKKHFEAQKGLFLHLSLVDEATDKAADIRGKLEKTFKTPITQTVKIRQADGGIVFRKSPRRSRSGSGGDAGGFQTPSRDTTGFAGGVSSFSAGIDRVPRDMFAVIHKDETVLAKTEAEERRRGISGGMAIQSVNINMNMPESFNPSNMSRQNFRQFALRMQDELRRLDARRSR